MQRYSIIRVWGQSAHNVDDSRFLDYLIYLKIQPYIQPYIQPIYTMCRSRSAESYATYLKA